MDYTERFDAKDRERIFRFFALFSRLEYSLKRTGFVRAGRHGEAEADWGGYARCISEGLAACSETRFVSARQYLLTNPPKRLALIGGCLVWRSNPRRSNEGEPEHLLRVVKDVRNNLFHGGKFPQPDGPVGDLARDRHLLDCATIVLATCLRADDRLERIFEEAA